MVADARVGTVILIGPELFARLLIQADNPLALMGMDDAVRKIDSAVGDRRAAVAGANFDAPLGRQLAGCEFLHDAGFPPDAVAVGTAPLRPVVGGGGGNKAD